MSSLAWVSITAYERQPWAVTAREYDQFLDLIAAATTATERDWLFAKSLPIFHAAHHSLSDAVHGVEQRLAEQLVRVEARS